MFKQFLLIVLLLNTLIGMAQVSDDQLANEYFQNGEFDKAALYYEKLFDEVPSGFYFERLFGSYLGQDKINEAEQLIKKHIRRNPGQLTLRIDLGQLYASQDKRNDAEKEYDKVLKDLESNRGAIVSVARKFTQIGENKYALKTYEKGQQLINGFNVFNYELAELYGQMGEYDKMVELYLQLIETNAGYAQSIQNALNRNFDFDEPGENITALKNGLLKKIQKDPGNGVFSEMLIWLYLQQKDFYGAFIQTKALDKRQNESGSRLIELGRLYLNNEAYKLAEKCFEVVADKGASSTQYYVAQTLRLHTKKVALEADTASGTPDWEDLALIYEAYLNKEGLTDRTQRSLRQLAEIKALRLNQLDEAIALIEQLLQIPRLSETAIAKAKIDQGDYYLMNDEVWEAALLFGQVEKMFKYDQLGEIAKFKYGKIGYYTGDFQWAKAQLDVLKGSTSKLIANDAMYISLLITDNSTIDTTIIPMQRFANADLYFAQKRYDESIALLDSINQAYPGHSLADDILFMKYKIYLSQKKYDEAAIQLEAIIANHSSELLGDEALFYLGDLYAHPLNNTEKAKTYFEKLLSQYPGSVFVAEARKQFRMLRGDQIN